MATVMKPKTIAIVILLVILPTALLSLIAARALRNEALLGEQRILRQAETAMDGVADSLRMDLLKQVEGIRGRLSTLLAANHDFGSLEMAGRALEIRNPYLRNIMLFMSPWGLVYPEAPDSAKTVISTQSTDRLRELLNEHVSPTNLVMIREGERLFCFSAFKDGSSLFVGFELRLDTYISVIQQAVEAASGPDYELRVAWPDPTLWVPLQVSDSLGQPVRRSPGPVKAAEGRFLAPSHFQPPMDFLELQAFLRNVDSRERQVRVRTTLTVWGIILLGGGIVFGLWLTLRQSAQELRAVRQRSELIVSASHDLRTPLASIKMLAETLEYDRVPDPTRRKEFLHLIVTGVRRLESMVERVLFLVRFDQKTLKYRFEDLDCASLIRTTVELFEGGIGARFEAAEKITIAQSIPEGLPRIRADEAAMSQVLMNLLENAAKYGPVAGRPCDVRIQVRYEGGDGAVEIEISDNGPGIPTELHKQIFEPYYRGPDADRADVSGVGLGLALCRHIIRSHDGDIVVESGKGQGSVFRITVPVAAKTG